MARHRPRAPWELQITFFYLKHVKFVKHDRHEPDTKVPGNSCVISRTYPPSVRFVTKTHAGDALPFVPRRIVSRARALGVASTPISKNRRSTGVAPRGQNVALGKEKRSRGSLSVRFVTKTHAREAWGGSPPANSLPRAGRAGVGNTPISKTRRSTGVAPRGENVALGKEKRSR